jgi:hypothetical protein
VQQSISIAPRFALGAEAETRLTLGASGGSSIAQVGNCQLDDAFDVGDLGAEPECRAQPDAVAVEVEVLRCGELHLPVHGQKQHRGSERWRALILLARPGGVVVSVHVAPATSSTIVVAVDIGKCSAVVSATDAGRRRLLGPVGFGMTRSDLAAVVDRIGAAIGPSAAQVKVGVEAARHYHRPVLDYAWPTGWEVLELNPAHDERSGSAVTPRAVDVLPVPS